MSRRLRFLPPNGLVEVTSRTLQGRFLLQPTPAVADLCRGVLARAVRLHPVEVHAFAFLGNHYHLLLSVPNAQRLSAFMNYLNSNLAREVGRAVRWRERFWGRRYQAIPVSEEESAQVERITRWVSLFAVNSGTHDGAGARGGRLKRWGTMGDDSVRDTHRRADGQVVSIGDAFTVAGVKIRYPGEPVGPPEVWMNCRCLVQPTASRGEADVSETTFRMSDSDLARNRLAALQPLEQGITAAADTLTNPDGTPYTPQDLREIQDWVIKPQLRNVPGVVEVNSIGGFEKQFHITPHPERLIAFNLGFHDIVAAIARNNANVGAGYIERNGEDELLAGRVVGDEVVAVGSFERKQT